MRKIISSKKGSALVAVLLIVTVLVILSSALLTVVVERYKATRSHENIETAYFSSDSVVEQCFDYINRLCSNGSLGAGITYTNDNDFAAQIVGRIEADMETTFGTNAAGDINFDYDIEDNAANTANTTVTIEKLGERNSTDPARSDKLVITIGIRATTNYSIPMYSAGNKVVFAKREFEVSKLPRFYLRAPINTIGDLFVNNGIEAEIRGDVRVYGTSPEFVSQPWQYYYGGIYARSNSRLTITGNAYTRSFVRAGNYGDSSNDNSEIRIYKDVVANGVQVFGKKDRIVIYRNAYTFDDVEMNGEDSVIAINGSYFGLSQGDGTNHDSASAIVNSAVVHHSSSNLSKISRIAVNGDAFINGGTFKLDSTNLAIGQIEDAAVAYSKNEDKPMYKVYDWTNYGISDYYGIPWLANPRKNPWILDHRTEAKGFANLLQLWNIISLPDFDTMDALQEQTLNNNVDSWLSKVDTVRNTSSGTNKARDGVNNLIFDNVPRDYITGVCRNLIAANYSDIDNNSLFFLNPNGVAGVKEEREIRRAQFPDISFRIPDAANEIGMPLNFWGDMTNATDYAAIPWAEYTSDLSLHTNSIFNKLNLMRAYLLNVTDDFATREYNYATNIPAPVNNVNKILNGLKASPASITPSLDGSVNLFTYLRDEMSGLPGSNVIKINDNVANDATGSTADLSTVLPGNLYSSTYFLVVNKDPELTFEVTGNFNGIIFSMGKVVLKNGANVTGAIIAAGRGYSPTPNGSGQYVDKSAATDNSHMPIVDQNGNNLSNLDDGEYAGVQFTGAGNAVVRFPAPDPANNLDSRQVLLNELNIPGLDRII
ncbi:MAG: hypothetical protein N3B21_06380 [Clostridia bacterium]|nr:hypothetical protein [Clostridia bacterium]